MSYSIDQLLRGSDRHADHHVAGFEHGGHWCSFNQAQISSCLVGDHGTGGSATREGDIDLTVDCSSDETADRPLQLVSGAEAVLGCTREQSDPGRLGDGHGLGTDGQPKGLHAGLRQHGHDFVATGRRDFDFSIDRSFLDRCDLALEYVSCTDRHFEIPSVINGRRPLSIIMHESARPLQPQRLAMWQT